MLLAGPNGRNQVRTLVAGLAYVSQALAPGSNRKLSDYLKWRGGADLGNGLPLYSQFSADFAKLGPDISIVSFGFIYNGNQAALNAQGNMLINVSPLPSNVSDPFFSRQNLTRLMCGDLIYHSSALQQMALAPPVPVVQPYLQCTPSLQSAFVTAAGIAAANASLLSTIFLGLAVFLAVQYISAQDLKLLSPAQKALRAEQTDKRLLANDERLFAHVERLSAENQALRANDASLRSELSLLKLVLTEQNPALAKALVAAAAAAATPTTTTTTTTQLAVDTIPPAPIPTLTLTATAPARLTVSESLLLSQPHSDNPLHQHSTDSRKML